MPGWALLWFDIHKFFIYPSGWLHWHWVNHMMVPLPVKPPWSIWIHKSMFRTCSTPWTTWISIQERCWMLFLGIQCQNGQMTLKVMVNDPHFQYQLRESQDAYSMKIWWFLLKSITSYCMDKPNFLEFWVKMPQMTLKIKVNNPHFQYQLRLSHDACLVQIWWFQLKSVRSYRADKVKFTDGQMDAQTERWTDACNDKTSLTWKAKG